MCPWLLLKIYGLSVLLLIPHASANVRSWRKPQAPRSSQGSDLPASQQRLPHASANVRSWLKPQAPRFSQGSDAPASQQRHDTNAREQPGWDGYDSHSEAACPHLVTQVTSDPPDARGKAACPLPAAPAGKISSSLLSLLTHALAMVFGVCVGRVHSRGAVRQAETQTDTGHSRAESMPQSIDAHTPQQPLISAAEAPAPFGALPASPHQRREAQQAPSAASAISSLQGTGQPACTASSNCAATSGLSRPDRGSGGSAALGYACAMDASGGAV